MPSKIHTIVATLLTLTYLNASAQDFSWDSGGANNKYETSANWDMNVLPFSTGKNTISVDISDGGTVTFDDRSGKQVIDFFNLNEGSVLNMTGGELDHIRSGNIVRTSVGVLGVGTSQVNQSGGKMSIGHILRLGDRNASGIYNLSGGSLVIYRGGRSLMGAPDGASLSLGGRGAVAEFNISGGSLSTRGGVEIEQNASLKVAGTGASVIGIGTQQERNHGFWYQKGTLSVEIGEHGVTTIQVASGDEGGQFVEFFAGAELDLKFRGAKPINGAWTVIELEGADIVDHGLVLSNATKANPGWSFRIDNSGPNGRLIANYGHYADVPEPMSYSLILGSVLGMLVFVRRRR